jgi:hypothetical protein
LGANICATPDIALLSDIQPLDQPFDIVGADSRSSTMQCTHGGYFTLHFSDQPSEKIFMVHCAALSTTIISPQYICSHPVLPFSGFVINILSPTTPTIQFFYHKTNNVATARLVSKANLFYFLIPPKIHNATRQPLLDAELWHLRLGHPGQSQLLALSHAADGLPPNLHKHVHPFSHCTTCDDANPRRSAMGPTVNTAALPIAGRFHIDFGFMRASSVKFTKTAGASRVVTSFDGFNAFLLIVDATSRYSWVFPTISKAAPLDILDTFLAKYGQQSNP